mgnify:CR=1 FL=1
MSVEYSEIDVSDGSIGLDPLFVQTLNYMQQGQWHEAAQALVALERRYPDYAELQQARQVLALHLSAEQTWVDGTSRPVTSALREAGQSVAASVDAASQSLGPSLQAPVVRVLLVANVLVYLLLGGILLLRQYVNFLG